MRKSILSVCAVVSIFFAAQAAYAEKQIYVVATTGMIADVARNIGGDDTKIVTLIGSGIDPHLYKATRSDIATLMAADIIFYNGLLLEGKMSDALVRVAMSGRKVYAVTELLNESFLLEPSEMQGHFDPHVWMDPTAWKQTAIIVRDKLAEFRPHSKNLFFRNCEIYLEKLEELDSYARKVLSSVPEKSRVLVSAHDAFNYFGRRYNFEVLGIQGLSTESEAGIKDIENLVSTLVDRKIAAVFVESTISERNIRALIEGAKARGHEVKIGGQLFSDAMGKAGTYQGTYIGMIDHNVTTIAKSLGGNPPAKGMNNEL